MKIFYLFFIGVITFAYGSVTAYCGENYDSGETPAFFVLPAAMYSTDTSFGGGFAGIASYHTSSDRLSTLQLFCIYTAKKQFSLATKWEHNFNGNRDRISAAFEYSKFPKDFFGLGNETSNKNPESYTPEFTVSRLFYERILVKHLKVKTQFFIYNQSLVKSEQYGKVRSTAIPFSTGRFDAGPGIGLLWDSRDNYYATKRGTFAQLEYLNYLFQNDGGSFNSLSLDIRKFFNPFSEFVAASMFWLQDRRGAIPFYLHSQLGGNDRLRGYEYDRFLGRSLILFQQDIRFPVWGPFGGAAFIASGRVADRAADLFSGVYHSSYGIGFRYFIDKEDNLVVRFDAARGKDSTGIYITFAEAF